MVEKKMNEAINNILDKNVNENVDEHVVDAEKTTDATEEKDINTTVPFIDESDEISVYDIQEDDEKYDINSLEDEDYYPSETTESPLSQALQLQETQQTIQEPPKELTQTMQALQSASEELTEQLPPQILESSSIQTTDSSDITPLEEIKTVPITTDPPAKTTRYIAFIRNLLDPIMRDIKWEENNSIINISKNLALSYKIVNYCYHKTIQEDIKELLTKDMAELESYKINEINFYLTQLQDGFGRSNVYYKLENLVKENINDIIKKNYFFFTATSMKREYKNYKDIAGIAAARAEEWEREQIEGVGEEESSDMSNMPDIIPL